MLPEDYEVCFVRVFCAVFYSVKTINCGLGSAEVFKYACRSDGFCTFLFAFRSLELGTWQR